MGKISIVYNIGRNIISGSIILCYVNVVRTPDYIMCYGTDGLITTHKNITSTISLTLKPCHIQIC